jgi:hypothetical protein
VSEKLEALRYATTRKIPYWSIYKPPEEYEEGICLEMFSRGSHAVTQLQDQTLVRTSSSEYPKSRQNLVRITFSSNKNHHLSIVLWAKPHLNDALPINSKSTWREYHPLSSSVSGYSTWRVKHPTAHSKGYYMLSVRSTYIVACFPHAVTVEAIESSRNAITQQ